MLAGLCGASDLRVLLMAGPLRVVHVSAHRSLRRAVEAVTVASVRRTIELADRLRPPAARPAAAHRGGRAQPARRGGRHPRRRGRAVHPPGRRGRAIPGRRRGGAGVRGHAVPAGGGRRGRSGCRHVPRPGAHPGQAARPGRGGGGHAGPAVPADVPRPRGGLRHRRAGCGAAGQHDRRHPGRRGCGRAAGLRSGRASGGAVTCWPWTRAPAAAGRPCSAWTARWPAWPSASGRIRPRTASPARSPSIRLATGRWCARASARCSPA